MSYLGDYADDATIHIMFSTNDGSGGAVAPSTAFEAADVTIYKNNSATQKTTTNGVTMTSPFDSITGLHQIVIDTSDDTGDAGFWAAGNDYTVVMNPDETVDSQAVVAAWHFSIENRVAGALGTQAKEDVLGGIAIESDTLDQSSGTGLSFNSLIPYAGLVEHTIVLLKADRTETHATHIVAADGQGVTIASAAPWTYGNDTAYILPDKSLYNAQREVELSTAGLAAVNAEADQAISDASLATAADIAGLNDVSTLEVTAAATSALSSYDPPTKTELDAAVADLAASADVTAVAGDVTTLLSRITAARAAKLDNDEIAKDVLSLDVGIVEVAAAVNSLATLILGSSNATYDPGSNSLTIYLTDGTTPKVVRTTQSQSTDPIVRVS